MNFYKKALCLLALITITSSTFAVDKEKGKFTHKIVAGYHFGATTPIPIPREVRSITSVWPQFTPQLGYNVSYQLDDQWAVESGITLDMKGVGVRNKVKYMYTDVTMDEDNIKGYFTGKNETRMKMSYVTVPIRLAYDLTPTWRLRAGGYFSYRQSSEFSGSVWDGYIRQTDNQDILNSTRINIDNKDDATFDFGKEMRNFDMGVSAGFEHQFIGRFGIYTDITYSLTPIFPSSFKGIDMKMRNIYIAVGASYRL